MYIYFYILTKAQWWLFNQAVVHSLASSTPPGFHSQGLEGGKTLWMGRFWSLRGCWWLLMLCVLLSQGSLNVLSLSLAHSDTCSLHAVLVTQHDYWGAREAPATGTGPIKGRQEGTASSQWDHVSMPDLLDQGLHPGSCPAARGRQRLSPLLQFPSGSEASGKKVQCCPGVGEGDASWLLALSRVVAGIMERVLKLSSNPLLGEI